MKHDPDNVRGKWSLHWPESRGRWRLWKLKPAPFCLQTSTSMCQACSQPLPPRTRSATGQPLRSFQPLPCPPRPRPQPQPWLQPQPRPRPRPQWLPRKGKTDGYEWPLSWPQDAQPEAPSLGASNSILGNVIIVFVFSSRIPHLPVWSGRGGDSEAVVLPASDMFSRSLYGYLLSIICTRRCFRPWGFRERGI